MRASSSRSFVHEFEFANDVGRVFKLDFAVGDQQRFQRLIKGFGLGFDFPFELVDGILWVVQFADVFDLLAVFHLLHQKRGVLQGLLLDLNIDALLCQHVLGAFERIFKGLETVVDLGRFLHGQQLLVLSQMGETVRMHRALQRTVSLCQLGRVQGELERQLEKVKVVQGRAFGLARQRWRLLYGETLAAATFAFDVGIVELKPFVQTLLFESPARCRR